MKNKMVFSVIPGVSKPVSQLVFGTAIRPFLYAEDCCELLDAVLDAGINTLDTARNYGNSEYAIGNWLEKSGRRGEVVLISKCGHPTAENRHRLTEAEMRKDFQISSEALHTNYIDIYLLHRDDPTVDAGTVVEVFNALHAEGKIGAFGGSNWTHQRIEAANEYAYKHGLIPFHVSSPNFGLADQQADPWGGGCVTISGPKNEDARQWYREHNMPVVAYSSLGRGFFSGKVKSDTPKEAASVLDVPAMKGYANPDNFERLRRCEILAREKGVSVAQIAMSWIFRQQLPVHAVVSTLNLSRLESNIQATALKLSPEEVQWLDLRRDEYA